MTGKNTTDRAFYDAARVRLVAMTTDPAIVASFDAMIAARANRRQRRMSAKGLWADLNRQ